MTEQAERMPRELLARRSEQLMKGAKRLYDAGPNQGDMWFFELYHHLHACAVELRVDGETSATAKEE